MKETKYKRGDKYHTFNFIIDFTYPGQLKKAKNVHTFCGRCKSNMV